MSTWFLIIVVWSAGSDSGPELEYIEFGSEPACIEAKLAIDKAKLSTWTEMRAFCARSGFKE